MKTKNVLIAFVCILFCLPLVAQAGFGDTNTLVGRQYNPEGSGAEPLESYLDNPSGFAFGANGDIYMADKYNNVIRKYERARGVVTTHAGTGDFGKLDGFRPLTTWGYPEDIEVDRDGNLYVADTLNNRIRKIVGNEVITIVSEGLSHPRGLMIRGDQLFIADTGHNRLLRCNLDGSNLIVEESNLVTPTKMDWSGDKVYFLNEGHNSVESINLSIRPGQEGRRRRVAGGFVNLGGLSVHGDYLYVTAGRQGVWNEIWSISLSDENDKELLQQRRETEMLNYSSDLRFYRPDPTNRPSYFQMYVLFSGGNSMYTFEADGSDEQILIGKERYNNEVGTRSETLIGRPQALAMTPDGNKMYIVGNHRFYTFDLRSVTSTEVAGSSFDSYTEGTGSAVRTSDPTQIAADPDGKTVYFVDRNNHRIRKIDMTTGTTEYITGAGEINFFGDYSAYQEGGPCAGEYERGVAGCAYFNRPTGIVLAADGATLYGAEVAGQRIRAVEIATGATSLVAGSGVAGFRDGIGSSAQFNGPYTMSLSSDGRGLYVTDKYNHAIRRVDLYSKEVNTIVGKGVPGYSEAGFSDAYLAIPEYIITDPVTGNLYFTEAGNFRVRMVDFSAGVTRLVAGTGDRGTLNAAGGRSTWSGPKGLAIKGRTLFVADYYNDLIRYVDINR